MSDLVFYSYYRLAREELKNQAKLGLGSCITKHPICSLTLDTVGSFFISVWVKSTQEEQTSRCNRLLGLTQVNNMVLIVQASDVVRL